MTFNKDLDDHQRSLISTSSLISDMSTVSINDMPASIDRFITTIRDHSKILKDMKKCRWRRFIGDADFDVLCLKIKEKVGDVLKETAGSTSEDLDASLRLVMLLTAKKVGFKAKKRTVCSLAVLFAEAVNKVKCTRRYIANLDQLLLNLSRFYLNDPDFQKAVTIVMAKWLDTIQPNSKHGAKLHLKLKYELARRFLKSNHKERVPLFIVHLLKIIKYKDIVKPQDIQLTEDMKAVINSHMDLLRGSGESKLISSLMASMDPSAFTNFGIDELVRPLVTQDIKDAWMEKLCQSDSDTEALRRFIEAEAEWILEHPDDCKVQSLLKTARSKLLDQYAKINYITKRVIPIDDFTLIQSDVDFEKEGQPLPVTDIYTQMFTYARKRNTIISVCPEKETMECFRPKGAEPLPAALIKTLEENIKKTWETQGMVQVSTIVEPESLLRFTKYTETGLRAETYIYDGLLNHKPLFVSTEPVSAIAEIQHQTRPTVYNVLGLFVGQHFKVINPRTRKVIAKFTQEQMEIYKMFTSKSDREALISTKTYGTCLVPGDDFNRHVFSMKLRKKVEGIYFPYTGSWTCYLKKDDKLYLYCYSKVLIFDEATLTLLEEKPTMIATPAICFELDGDRIGIFEEKWPILVIHDLKTHKFKGYSLYNKLDKCYDVSDIGPLPPLIRESADRLSVGVKTQDASEAWFVSLDLTQFK